MPSIYLALDVIRLTADPNHSIEARCPTCHEPLAVHQPDVELPDRLLDICLQCRAWFLVNISSGVMIRLPDPDALRDL
jgi:hypothetical protein